MAQRIINSSRVESNQTAPSQLLFGNALHLDRSIFLPASVIQAQAPANRELSTWSSQMLKAEKEIIDKTALVQRTKDWAHCNMSTPVS